MLSIGYVRLPVILLLQHRSVFQYLNYEPQSAFKANEKRSGNPNFCLFTISRPLSNKQVIDFIQHPAYEKTRKVVLFHFPALWCANYRTASYIGIMASKALEYKQPFLLSSLRKSDCFVQWVEKVSEVSEVSEVLTKKALVSMITPF